jgi:N-acetylglucosamine-6-phosphate deacetylase
MAFTLRTRPGHVALVSDVVSGSGDRVARLADGTLMGSLVAVDESIRVAVAAGVGLAPAVAAATRTPALVLGEPVGRLEPGCLADFVVLDEALRPTATYVGGELLWAA